MILESLTYKNEVIFPSKQKKASSFREIVSLLYYWNNIESNVRKESKTNKALKSWSHRKHLWLKNVFKGKLSPRSLKVGRCTFCIGAWTVVWIAQGGFDIDKGCFRVLLSLPSLAASPSQRYLLHLEITWSLNFIRLSSCLGIPFLLWRLIPRISLQLVPA
jgi:hypothetical protein